MTFSDSLSVRAMALATVLVGRVSRGTSKGARATIAVSQREAMRWIAAEQPADLLIVALELMRTPVDVTVRGANGKQVGLLRSPFVAGWRVRGRGAITVLVGDAAAALSVAYGDEWLDRDPTTFEIDDASLLDERG